MDAGLVLKTTGSHYRVKMPNGDIVDCTIRGKLRLKGVKTTNPVTVGDFVQVELSDRSSGVITAVNDRKNYIIRKSTNLSRESHIIAANLDQAVLVVTIEFPETQLGFIDRYLVTAEAYSIPAVIVFNKVDLLNDAGIDKLNQYVSVYEPIGYKCLVVSAQTGYNMSLFRDLIQGKTSLISGNSGVGKSTLVNTVEPNLNLRTNNISSAHLTGKHTTTFSEIFELSFGGYIIDTPGIKGFGLIDIEKNELYHFFPEIFKFSSDCKYYNCTHIHEPGCAVVEAAKNGEISPSRYLNYLSIYEDDNEKYR
ncbi:MAG TPA: ribosome small subunit-dependent GTPase A [Tenuifilaceae bacterium]|nr:ribosome small subunit-dependent GTPase A [Tenuifilaceae bacterium]HPI43593.1 ribosome small subunit-dependent GTPase A [Tenuifilaceae bacterium]HPN21538.1 ribosome small subunit-dependent GTPase A [Tenuifilaceae bacterium]HPV55604.1 ribosome small subunit-dependent GTPase A [Tenuifilaceae bacterium]